MRLNKLIVLTGLAALSLLVGCNSNSNKSSEDNEDTLDTLEADAWIVMFDGKTSDGWRGYAKETFPAAWVIEDGVLHIQGSGRGEAGAVEGGDILYDRKFGISTLLLNGKLLKGPIPVFSTWDRKVMIMMLFGKQLLNIRCWIMKGISMPDLVRMEIGNQHPYTIFIQPFHKMPIPLGNGIQVR